MTHSSHNPQNWFLLTLLTLIWGTSYILIKKGLASFSALELACLRISISFAVSLPIALYSFRQIPRERFGTILLVGLFGTGLPSFLFALSMTKSGSALNGILNSLSPLWTLIIGGMLFGVPIGRKKALGVAIGFLGALILVLGKGGGLQGDIWYSLLPVVATFCYGMSSNLTKQKMQHLNPVYSTSLSMVMIGMPAFAALLFTRVPEKIISGNVTPALFSVVYLSVIGTLLAWVLFYRLVQRTDALFAASVTYLIPVVAVMWGLLDGEVLNVIQVGGMLLILTGVYFTTGNVPPKTR